MNQKTKQSGFKAFLTLFTLLKGNWSLYIISIAALGLTVAAEMAGFMVIRQVVDGLLISAKGLNFLLTWASVYLFLALIKGALSYVHGRGKAHCSEKVTQNIRNTLYDHLQRLSFAFHDNSQTGELVQRSTSDVDTVRKFFANQIPEVSQVFFQFTINLAILLFLEWRLALFSVIVVPVVGVLSTVFFFKIFNAYDEYQEVEGKMSNRIQENLSGIRVVRAFARQDWEKERFQEINELQRKKGLRLTWWHSIYWPFGHILCGFQFSLTLLLGGYMAMRGTITPGTFIAFSSLVNALIWPMQELGRTITEISKSHVSYRRIREILDEAQEDLESGNVKDAHEIRGNLEFLGAGFRYGSGEKVLDDISFSCREGEKIALLGATGSGKTTLVNLLPRFYDYSEGKILLDGSDLHSYNRHSLRQHIGIVQQEPFLFSMTVAENICYSLDREVSREEMETAAKAAAVHDSIVKFPKGYETMVGEKGVSLSGGQKQRIAIARTLLKDPRILILDDSTSAVDADTEAKIKKAMDELMKGRTTFIIAHRIQTLKQADRILVLERGRIVQQGCHGELITVDGFYKDVFNLQTQMEEELQQELLTAAAVGGE
ncbi:MULTISPECIES: ABC transporter ATP-binding protein [unclassified Oceanispirochaeta]|uniref:ABC transporter ATP-binding protein n=1 Tax=unclassified Oceanispirochaeta TaxID=2635722 RepID=UPI000E091696|nr:MULTISPECIES: ABC transporter ATP-binding protein [unclassified Oceanispirochaeta]MBF9014463.1 ABC transporter ATP-binding protein [Oceanispirochaeta sp. M2]NPD70719.1 ABC transporter ATP-binding protein [Oceanispirochaeta sp. M1]RDG34003.1 ABC transporter ATP-binding protein [Oceanispirochaeta sp. M1]